MNFRNLTACLVLIVSCNNKNKFDSYTTKETNEKQISTVNTQIIKKDTFFDPSKHNIKKNDTLSNYKKVEKINSEKLNGIWHLIKVNGKNLNELSFIRETPPKPLIEFNLKNKTVGGAGECNSFDGNLKINGTNIKIENMMSTEVKCGEFESNYYKVLSDCKYSFSDNGNLILRNKQITFEFTKK